MNISVSGESKIVKGHVLDVSAAHLTAALRRYDSQLYLKWAPKKRSGLGLWELRRRPELKSVREGYYLDVPKRGRVLFPGDIYDMGEYTITVPKYHETREDCIKTFERLDYRIVEWVAKQDLWQYGFKGRYFAQEAEYKQAKFEEKIDEESFAEKQYGLKQMRTQINDFREYVLAGGDPYRLLDFWEQ